MADTRSGHATELEQVGGSAREAIGEAAGRVGEARVSEARGYADDDAKQRYTTLFVSSSGTRLSSNL